MWTLLGILRGIVNATEGGIDLKDASDVLINLYHFFLRCRFQARRRIKRALVRLVPHLRQPVPCRIASVPEPWVHA